MADDDEPVRRIVTRRTWDDLELSPSSLRQLKELESLARRGGPSGCALFHGPSGTGKTLTAGVLGGRLEQPLYRVDLARVVSKYIGETEKNLTRLFRSAEERGWILLFDEADALFGKRTGVRDAHDRYANLEVSWLLQRMEEFRGLAILATNSKQNVDPAFQRRCLVVVDFSDRDG